MTVQVSNAQILEEVTKITQTFAAFESLSQKVDDHDKFINGNGKPGQKVLNNQIEERIKVMTSNIERLEKIVEGMQEMVKKFAIGIVTAGAAWVLFTVLPDIIKLIQ